MERKTELLYNKVLNILKDECTCKIGEYVELSKREDMINLYIDVCEKLLLEEFIETYKVAGKTKNGKYFIYLKTY